MESNFVFHNVRHLNIVKTCELPCAASTAWPEGALDQQSSSDLLFDTEGKAVNGEGCWRRF